MGDGRRVLDINEETKLNLPQASPKLGPHPPSRATLVGIGGHEKTHLAKEPTSTHKPVHFSLGSGKKGNSSLRIYNHRLELSQTCGLNSHYLHSENNKQKNETKLKLRN